MYYRSKPLLILWSPLYEIHVTKATRFIQEAMEMKLFARHRKAPEKFPEIANMRSQGLDLVGTQFEWGRRIRVAFPDTLATNVTRLLSCIVKMRVMPDEGSS